MGSLCAYASFSANIKSICFSCFDAIARRSPTIVVGVRNGSQHTGHTIVKIERKTNEWVNRHIQSQQSQQKKPDMANKPLEQTKKKRKNRKMTMTKKENTHAEGHFCGTDYKVETEKLLGRKICLVHTQEKVERKKLIVHKMFAFARTFGNHVRNILLVCARWAICEMTEKLIFFCLPSLTARRWLPLSIFHSFCNFNL